MKAASRNCPSTITVHVPLRFTTRGNTKRIVSEGTSAATRVRLENALIKALARAHRWHKMIESGGYSSITELAKAENENQSYACRLLRLTLLGPELVTSILDGRQPISLQLDDLLRPLPSDWAAQHKMLMC